MSPDHRSDVGADGADEGLDHAFAAVTLRAANGAEILIHIGLETVALAGEGFKAHVHAGHKVKAGDLLISFDIDLLARRAKSLITPIIITNHEAFAIVWREKERETEVGARLMDLQRSPSWTNTFGGLGDELRQIVTLGLPHGLHARPSGRLAALAKSFAADVSIQTKGRSANAKSPIALMTLGAVQGDELQLVGKGADAGAALTAFASFLASDGGENRTPAVLKVSPSKVIGSPIAGVLQGVIAVPGHAIGQAIQFRRQDVHIVVESRGAPSEQAALVQAIDSVRANLKSSTHDADEAQEVRTAHAAFLEDAELHASANLMIMQGRSAGWAWSQALDVQVDVLRRLDDDRLRARAADLIDLKRQVLLALGGKADVVVDLPPDAVLMADELLPSELMALSGRIIGLCTSGGGPTSHVAIIAAGLGLPYLAAAGHAVLNIGDETPVILDADAGRLHIAPSEKDLETARSLNAARSLSRATAISEAAQPCRMADGTRIEIFANLAGVAEAALALLNGAEGCGLLRTEFLFMDRAEPPSEEEQRAAYQAIADVLDGRPLIVRTLDIGGDKPVAYLPLPRSDNPALSLRGVRVSLWRPEILRTQLRAILRVKSPGPCKITIPMISSMEELQAVKAILLEEQRALAVDAPMSLGVMIETPAAAMMAAAIATEADVFSIGVNDLTQYTLAMDRTDSAVASGLDALHPAVLRLIAMTCEGAKTKGRPVGVCGGLASDPLAAPLLIGLGVTELSVAQAIIPELKAAIRPLSMDDCRVLAMQTLAQTSAAEVRSLLVQPLAGGKGAVK